MIGLAQAFYQEIANGPWWVYWWVNFMSMVLSLAVPFAFFRAEARWLLLVIVLTFPLMLWLYSQFGYQRILGLAHVLIWTPYIVYLWQRRDQWRVRQSLSGKWILLVFVTMIASLCMDYIDVGRYLLGERQP